MIIELGTLTEMTQDNNVYAGLDAKHYRDI
jgi:hypothetical protein